jgi:hypothetical protein
MKTMFGFLVKGVLESAFEIPVNPGTPNDAAPKPTAPKKSRRVQ